MGILIFAAAGCALVWLCVAVARGWISFGWMACPTLIAGLVILVGSMFGRDFYYVQVGPLPITLDRILWVWMILQFFTLVITKRARLLSLNAVDYWVGGLLLLLTISTLSHDFTYRDNLPLTRLLFFNVLPIGIYFVVRHAPLGDRQLVWILYGFAAFGTYLAGTGIAEWRNWPQFVFPAYIMDRSSAEFFGRARGPFLNPVACGIFQITGMIAVLLLWPRHKTFGRIFSGALLVLFTIGIFATFTRSVWLALAVGLTITLGLLASNRGRGALLIVGASAAAMFFVLFSDDIQAFKRDKDVTESEMSESVLLRPLLAEVAINMFSDRPVFGHGFGQYSQAKRLYHQEVSNSPLKKVLPYMQHNVVLSYLTETGGVGVAVLLTLLWLYAATALRLFYRSPKNSLHRAVAILGLVVLSSFFINGMFHDVTIIPMIGSLFFFLLGLTNHLESVAVRLTTVDESRQPFSVARLPEQRRAS